jgi:uncharacterized protein
MGNRIYVPLHGIVGLILAMLLLGCSRTPSVKYYTLQAAQSPTLGSRELGNMDESGVGIGPVRIPDYLDRFQIVSRSGSDSLEIDDFHKWAEPLESNITRTMVQNLSALLPQSAVMGFPWRQTVPLKYQIPLEILSFEGDDQQKVSLLARWQVHDQIVKKIVTTRESRIMVETADLSYKSLVEAQSQALAELSEEMADAIQELMRP